VRIILMILLLLLSLLYWPREVFTLALEFDPSRYVCPRFSFAYNPEQVFSKISGNILTFKCRLGYSPEIRHPKKGFLLPLKSIMCRNGVWDDVLAGCKLIECPEVKVAHAHVSANRLHLARLEIECDSDYELSDNSDIPILCGDDGKWHRESEEKPLTRFPFCKSSSEMNNDTPSPTMHHKKNHRKSIPESSSVSPHLEDDSARGRSHRRSSVKSEHKENELEFSHSSDTEKQHSAKVHRKKSHRSSFKKQPDSKVNSLHSLPSGVKKSLTKKTKRQLDPSSDFKFETSKDKSPASIVPPSTTNKPRAD